MTKRSFYGWPCWVFLFLAGAVLGTFLPNAIQGLLSLQPALASDLKPLSKPPEGQTYVGVKNCASCHLDQFLDWRGTKHAKGFDILPEKYRADNSCLKCHTTGHGTDTGFKSFESTPQLVGAACESCHGPGSKHAEIAKSYGGKKLSKEEEAYVRSTVYRMQPKNVCVDCHLTRAHKKHPAYDK